MEYTIVELSSSENEVEIRLEPEEIKTDIEEEVKKQTKKIQMPGFRKGKVPATMIKKMYGEALEYEASEKVANSFFWKIANEKELKPIGQPAMTDLQFEPAKGLTFKVKYETLPSLDVKGYKGITFEVPDFVASDDEVNKEIEHLLKSNRKLEDADVVGDDKQFILDVEIIRTDKEGISLPDVKPEKLQIDLSNEGVQAAIIDNSRNKKVGDSFNFSFVDEHTAKSESGEDEHHQHEYYYNASILGIKKIVTPELTEELIKSLTKDKATTESELKEEIKKDIQSYYDQRVEEITRGKFISELIKANDFVPPKTLVNNILTEYLKSEEEQAKKSKYPFNREEAKKRLSPSAVNEVKWYLIKNEIQKKENIKVTDDDLKELAEKDFVKTGISVDKLLNYYKSSNHGERILDTKLFDFLKENNKIEKVDPKKFNVKKEEVNE